MSKYQKDLPPIPLPSPLRTGATYTNTQILPKQQPQQAEYYHAVLKHQNRRLQKQNEELQQTIVQQKEKITHLQDKKKECQQYIKKQNENFIQITRSVCSAFENYREKAVPMPTESLSSSPIDQLIEAYAAFSDSEGDFF
ncbi:hypothetical protein TARUN_8898 [Trichoderma arundinaceum]|uniref:Uncharacterized protein n=1 Tax=Trichoderma arundinaceum TaxID=490622 RepID=A0A395NB71_TRIAR|nr:hypothetical protein TARUN_8898 [Trichoderma arundinaceum]